VRLPAVETLSRQGCAGQGAFPAEYAFVGYKIANRYNHIRFSSIKAISVSSIGNKTSHPGASPIKSEGDYSSCGGANLLDAVELKWDIVERVEIV
jgi:hypothetical protein